MRLRTTLSRLAVLLLAGGMAAAQTAGRITAVRVYRGQALVTRTIEFTATAGAQELVIGDLPLAIAPSSLYATGDENLAIRAVRYRTEATAEEPRDDIRALDQQIAAKQDEAAKLQAEATVVDQHGRYLDRLEQFIAPTATAEMTKGVLDPEKLLKLTQYSLEQRTLLSTKRLDLQHAQRKVTDEIQLLTRKRSALTGGGPKATREAVVFLEAKQPGAAKVDLNYLVTAVSWAPAYIARLNGKQDKMVLEYHAVVTQTSGEDWKDVALTLSTSDASMQAESPALAPFYVTLVSANTDKQAADAKEYVEQRRELEEQLRGQNRAAKAAAKPSAAHRRTGAPSSPAAGGSADRPDAADEVGALPSQDNTPDLMEANVLAAKLQQIELTASDDAVKGARRQGDSRGGLAVDYPLPGRVSLVSRSDQQMFRITAVDLKPTCYYTCVPLLSDFVYQQVEAQNTSQYALLPGPYSAYIDGAYAGRGLVPLTASGQGLSLGFGTESRLKVIRELEDKKTETRGGNKQLKFFYRFRLQNFTDRPAQVRVWDRIPTTPNDQIAVTFTESTQKLSTDPLYLELERPRGLLRWDVEVPANAAGVQGKNFTYSLQLEFDKNYDIGLLEAELQQRMERDLASMKARKAR